MLMVMVNELNGDKDNLPRERILKYGIEALSDREIVAMLISTGVKGKNVLEIADVLLYKANGLRNLSVMSLNEISECDGVGIGKASRILAALELGKRVSFESNFKEAISCSDDVVNIVKPSMQFFDREVFKVLLLNVKNILLKIETVSVGGLNFSAVHPREVFKSAIKNSAGAIILVHNHPSGVFMPSDDDISVTERLVECGNILGIAVLDHLIICDDGYFSFKEKGLL